MNQTNRTKCISLLTAALLAGLVLPASPAGALTLDAAGNVTDWGVTPFPTGATVNDIHSGWAPSGAPMTTVWREENNYSPVQYPSGIGHVPSPGGNNGEMLDMEAVYARVNTSLATPSLQVLLVTSMPDHIYYSPWNRHYRIGDLFLDVNGDGVYDFAVANTAWDNGGAQPWKSYDPASNTFQIFTHGSQPGTIYQLQVDPADPLGHNDEAATVIGPNTGGYGGNAYVEGAVRPWVINQDVATVLQAGGSSAVAGLAKATFNYSADRGGTTILGGGYYADDNYPGTGSKRCEDNTWLYEYTIPLSWIDPTGNLTPDTVGLLGLHITPECGNDVLDVVGNPDKLIPEPLTILAVSMGVAGLARYTRRRARA